MSTIRKMAATRLICGLKVSPLMLGFMVMATVTISSVSVTAQESQPELRTKVKAYVQMHPGGEREEAEMPVYESPVDLPIVAAPEAELEDDDLVLGVLSEGKAMAWPIRYLAMYEVVNSKAGKKPVAPTW